MRNCKQSFEKGIYFQDYFKCVALFFVQENYEYSTEDTPIATQISNDSDANASDSLPIEPDQSMQDQQSTTTSQSHIQLTSHKKIANQRILKHTCTHCEKPFPSASNLERHLRTHTGSFRYIDTGNWFYTINKFMHFTFYFNAGEKPFECYQCDKKFTELSNLKKHFHTHTGLILF